jgi:16S rRNA (uracil1498-N3)-methyltransferase
MSLTRFYCREISDQCLLEGSEAHHLAGVMRLKAAQEVELFDGKGTLAQAVIIKTGKREVLLETREKLTAAPRTGSRIILAVSVARDQRFDWLIAKATELGVDHICPTAYHRTVKQGSGKNITQRYENIAISSAKQCKRLYLPLIGQTRSLDSHLDMLTGQYPGAVLAAASLADDCTSIFKTTLIDSPSDKIICIGPEGGFTGEEEKLLRDRGAICIRLTDTVLRIETAAVAVASILAMARQSLACN